MRKSVAWMKFLSQMIMTPELKSVSSKDVKIVLDDLATM